LEPRIINSCGALIRSNKTGRYLFLLRDKCSYGNTWGLPGGKFENGESTVEALERECEEELGIPLIYQKFIPIETFTSEDKRFVYHTVLLTVEREFVPILNEEHKGYCWVFIEDHPKPLHPGVWKTFNFDVVKDKLDTMNKLL
jgi:8-oxo-dGTP pyrophosphatase MutT (NUDIX family)